MQVLGFEEYLEEVTSVYNKFQAQAKVGSSEDFLIEAATERKRLKEEAGESGNTGRGTTARTAAPICGSTTTSTAMRTVVLMDMQMQCELEDLTQE